MPEVFTEENKNYYKYHNYTLTIPKETLLELRKEYVNMTIKDLWEKHSEYHDKLKYRTFEKLIYGDIKVKSVLSEVPVYKKKTQSWVLNGESVSTIPGSGE